MQNLEYFHKTALIYFDKILPFTRQDFFMNLIRQIKYV